MKLRDQYDWIVLGDHPGALLSAALVARLGLSVLILPLATGRRLLVSRSRQYYDPDPNLLVGLGAVPGSSPGLLSECLTSLGLMAAEREQIQVEAARPQALTPKFRLALGNVSPEGKESGDEDGSSLRQELDRELGASASSHLGWVRALEKSREELLSRWLRLPASLTVDPTRKRGVAPPVSLQSVLARPASDRQDARWFGLKERIGTLVDEELRQLSIALLQGTTTGTAPGDDPAAGELLHALAVGVTSARFRGGMTAYRELLLRIARRLGAAAPEQIHCRGLFINAGRLAGVQVSQHGKMIGATGGVLGCSLGQAQQHLHYGARSMLRHMKKPRTPVGWRFTLAATIHEEAIPPGMRPRAIWKERDAPALEIELARPADYQLADDGHYFLFARTLLPFSAEALKPSFQRMVAARMFRQLTELMPYLEFHVKRLFPDFRPAGDGSEFAEANPFTTPDEIPHNLRVYAGDGIGSRTGIDGLFLAGAVSYPRRGNLGGTVAALESAAWIAHRCGLPGPMVVGGRAS